MREKTFCVISFKSHIFYLEMSVSSETKQSTCDHLYFDAVIHTLLYCKPADDMLQKGVRFCLAHVLKVSSNC